MSKLISVTTDFEAGPTLRLRVDMDVVTPIRALPEMRVSLSGVEGSPVTDGVLLSRIDGEPLTVEADTEGGPIEVSALPATGPDAPPEAARHHPRPGDVWLSVSVDGRAGPVTRSGTIRLTTNQPDVPVLELPYAVRVRPMIESRPAQVQLWVTDGDQVASGSIIRLIHNGREAFPISSVSSSHPETFTAGTTDSQEPSVVHNLWVRVGEDVDPRSLPISGTVTIGLGGEPERHLEVPVVVALRKVFRRSSIEPVTPPPEVSPSAAAGTDQASDVPSSSGG